MYAYIETGGKQYKAAVGDRIKVEKIDAPDGSEVKLDKVLALIGDGSAVFGAPYVLNASVTAEVISTTQSDKVLIFKKRPRKVHMKLRGHRQIHTTLKIKDIQGV